MSSPRIIDKCHILDLCSTLSYSGIEPQLARQPFGRRAFSLEQRMTDAEILTLVSRLEGCLLAKEEFHHRDHLTVAVVYLYASNLEAAVDRMRTTLKHFAAHHSVSGLYHETLTRFWLRQVDERIDRNQCLRESVRCIQEQLNDKNLIFQYYSRERIDSVEAKESWLPPDKMEL